MDRPLITVIISTFNAEAVIRRALDSLNSQTFKDFEVVLADGASSDNTVTFAKSYNRLNLKIISEPDKGIYDAWNKALSIATGDFIFFLGSDDEVWSPTTFEQVSSSLISQRETAALFYGKVACVDEVGKIWLLRGEPWISARNSIGTHMSIPHQGVLSSKKLFNMTGGFDESYRITGDYEWILRAIKFSEPVFLDITVARFSTTGVSSQNYWSSWIETIKARRKNGRLIITIYDIRTVARIFARQAVLRLCGPKSLKWIISKKRLS